MAGFRSLVLDSRAIVLKAVGVSSYFACQLRRDAQNGLAKRAIEHNMRESSGQHSELAHLQFSSSSHL
jgi:hypothetical protein